MYERSGSVQSNSINAYTDDADHVGRSNWNVYVSHESRRSFKRISRVMKVIQMDHTGNDRCSNGSHGS